MCQELSLFQYLQDVVKSRGERLVHQGLCSIVTPWLPQRNREAARHLVLRRGKGRVEFYECAWLRVPSDSHLCAFQYNDLDFPWVPHQNKQTNETLNYLFLVAVSVWLRYFSETLTLEHMAPRCTSWIFLS